MRVANIVCILYYRFDISHTDIEEWVGRLLPSRLFGKIVLTTAVGIMDHEVREHYLKVS